MKKRLLSTLTVVGTTLGCAAIPMSLASCSCNSTDAKQYSVTVNGRDVTIDKNVATEGEKFTARISSDEPIVKITNISFGQITLPLEYYSYTISKNKVYCDVVIQKEGIIGDLTINVATRQSTNDLLVSITDDIDNFGIKIMEGYEWVDKEDAFNNGFDLYFSSDFPLALYYYEIEPGPRPGPTPSPESRKIWKQFVEVKCGDQTISQGAYSIAPDMSYYNYTIHFQPGFINDDITIHIGRLVAISPYQYPTDMVYYNPEFDDDIISPVYFLRGSKIEAMAMYLSGPDSTNEQVIFSGFDIYTTEKKLTYKEDYDWVPLPSESEPTASITIYSDVVLDYIFIDAHYTIR